MESTYDAELTVKVWLISKGDPVEVDNVVEVNDGNDGLVLIAEDGAILAHFLSGSFLGWHV